MKFSHSRSGRGRRRGRKCKLSAAEPRRGSVSVCVRVSVRVRGGSRGGLSAAHTHSTRRRDAPAHSTSPFSAARAGRKWPGLFSHCLGLPYLYFSRSLARSLSGARPAQRPHGRRGPQGRRAGLAPPAAPICGPSRPRAPRRRPPPRRPRSPPGLRLRGAHSGTHPGGARRRRAPPPRARCHESNQSDKLGGRGGGGPHASRRLRAGESPTRPPRPGSLPHGPTHPSPCARKEKKYKSLLPPFFPFSFLSLLFLFHTRTHYFRVRCPETPPPALSESLAHFFPRD